jgi:class III poly(R)-hydroxyalkanoic acid synthase PhaE subunit
MANPDYFSPEAIIENQKKFMESWFNFAQGAGSQAFNPANTQDDIFGPWQDMANRMMNAGKGYMEMAERFAGTAGDGLTLQQVWQDWAEQMSGFFSQIMAQPSPELKDAQHGPAAFWDMPQDVMNRAFSTIFPFPGDFLRAFRPEGLTRMPGDIHGHLDQFLSTPSVGYTRESQEQYKALGRLMIEYQAAMYEYNMAMAKVGQEAVVAFQARAAQKFTEPEADLSFKAMHNLWTQTAEEIYGAYVMTEEYTKIYGTVVNKMMAVKKQTARMVDEVFEAFNLPTRKEINTLHKRVQEIRRQSDFDMAQEIDSLKEKIAALEKKVDSRGTRENTGSTKQSRSTVQTQNSKAAKTAAPASKAKTPVNLGKKSNRNKKAK